MAQVLSQLKLGRLPVTRENLLGIITALAYPGRHAMSDAYFAFEKEFMGLIQPSWIEVLFDFFQNPVMGTVITETGATFEEYDSYITDITTILLREAVKMAPDAGWKLIRDHFPGESEPIRLALMSVLSELEPAEALPYLDAYAEQLNSLSPPEIGELIGSYLDLKDEDSRQRGLSLYQSVDISQLDDIAVIAIEWSLYEKDKFVNKEDSPNLFKEQPEE